MATLLDPRTKLCLTLPEKLANDFKSIFIVQYRIQHDALLAKNKQRRRLNCMSARYSGGERMRNRIQQSNI